MKIGTFFITAALALFVMAGFFASNNRALAAECAAEIADTTKQYAASRAKFKYSEKLGGRIEKMLKKARLRLDQGKKKRCFKIIKKVQTKIAYRENKAKGGGKQAGKGGKRAGKGGGNKAKCAAEIKATETLFAASSDRYDYAPFAIRFVDLKLSEANAFLKQGKYKKCRNKIKKAREKIDFFEKRG